MTMKSYEVNIVNNYRALCNIPQSVSDERILELYRELRGCDEDVIVEEMKAL